MRLRAREKPLVVAAVVARDDGSAGLGLAFEALPAEALRSLRDMVEVLPILSVQESAEGTGVVPTEILEQAEAPAG